MFTKFVNNIIHLAFPKIYVLASLYMFCNLNMEPLLRKVLDNSDSRNFLLRLNFLVAQQKK